MPKVSCVLPVYNGLPYLESAVASVLAQDFTDFELLLIDDGSTDGSSEIGAAIAASDARVRLITQANAGIVAALNRGVASAQGEYVARMDADDLCRVERFSKQVVFLDANRDVAAVGSRQRIIDGEGWPIHHTRGNRWKDAGTFPAGGITLCHPSVMFRRAAFARTRGYSEAFHAAEDYALWLEMSQYGRIYELGDYLIDYRVHCNSTSFNKLKRQRESCVKAELAYHARTIVADETLALRFEAATDLAQMVALLPVYASSGLPSRAAIKLYFEAQVVKRLANRAAIIPAAVQVVSVVAAVAAATPRLLWAQDRSTLRAAGAALGSAGWALARRCSALLFRKVTK